MDSELIVEQFMQNLSFEIQTSNQENPIRLKNKSKSTPLNVKVRVRKKEEAFQYGEVTVPKVYLDNEKIRLANSDQTILSFDLFMETDNVQNKPKKHRKKLLEIIKQGTCLSTESNDDDYAYLPSTSHKRSSREQSTTSKSDGVLKHHATLSKRNYVDSSLLIAKNNYFLGKCKTGGCLDPPFSEDKYSYTPAIDKLSISKQRLASVNNNQNVITYNSNSTSLKMENMNSSNANKNEMNEYNDNISILKLYEAVSINTSLSTTHSNSVITYPTLSSSECRIDNNKNVQNKVPINVNKNTVDQIATSYFIPPKTPVKHNEEDNSEITNLSVEEENMLLYNIFKINNHNNDGQYKLTYIDQLDNFDKKIEETNIDSNTKYITVNQNSIQDTAKKICNSHIEINKIQLSVETVPKGSLNEYKIQDNHESFISNTVTIDLPTSIIESFSKNKFDQSRKTIKQTIKPNNTHIFDTPSKLLVIESPLKKVIGSNVSINNAIEAATMLQQSSADTKMFETGIGESKHSITQPNDEQNTKVIMESSNTMIITLNDDLVKNISHNGFTNSRSFISNIKNIYKEGLPVTLDSQESNNIIYANVKNYDINILEEAAIGTQKLENNVSSELEKAGILTESSNNIHKSESIENYDISAEYSSLHKTKSKSKDKIETLTKYSITSPIKSSIENIHGPFQAIKISDYEITLQENDDFVTNKSNSYINLDTKSDHILDPQIVTQISELSVKKLKENINDLQNENKIDISNKMENQDNITEVLTKSPPIHKTDTEILSDKSRTTDLNYNPFSACMLEDRTMENNEYIQSSSNKLNSYTDTTLTLNNNSEKIEIDISTKLKDQKVFENKTSTTALDQDKFLTSHKSNSHLKYESFDTSVIADSIMENSKHIQNYSNKIDFNTESHFNNIKKIYLDIASKSTDQETNENKTSTKELEKDKLLKLKPKSSSDLVQFVENLSIPVMKLVESKTNKYKEKVINNFEANFSSKENISVNYNGTPTIRKPSIINIDKQLKNKNSILSLQESKYEEDKDRFKSEVNETIEIDISKSSDTIVLPTLITELQKQNSHVTSVNENDSNLIIVTNTLPIESQNLSYKEDNKKAVSLNLAFQSYTDNGNLKFLKTFASETEPKRYDNDTVLKLKTEINTSHYKLIIPIDDDNNMLVEVNGRSELPRSTTDKGTQVIQETKTLDNEVSNLFKKYKELRHDSLLSICEKELVPLQNAIKSLKEEIDSLSGQQLALKNNLYGIKKTSSVKFRSVGKRCGCSNWYF